MPGALRLTGYVPRLYREGKHIYAHCDYARLRWRVVILEGYAPAYRVERLT